MKNLKTINLNHKNTPTMNTTTNNTLSNKAYEYSKKRMENLERLFSDVGLVFVSETKDPAKKKDSISLWSLLGMPPAFIPHQKIEYFMKSVKKIQKKYHKELKTINPKP
jgi:hypothetical protein